MDAISELYDPLLELAAIFAAGILRLRERHALATTENSPNSTAASLELSPATPLSVHLG